MTFCDTTAGVGANFKSHGADRNEWKNRQMCKLKWKCKCTHKPNTHCLTIQKSVDKLIPRIPHFLVWPLALIVCWKRIWPEKKLVRQIILLFCTTIRRTFFGQGRFYLGKFSVLRGSKRVLLKVVFLSEGRGGLCHPQFYISFQWCIICFWI